MSTGTARRDGGSACETSGGARPRASPGGCLAEVGLADSWTRGRRADRTALRGLGPRRRLARRAGRRCRRLRADVRAADRTAGPARGPAARRGSRARSGGVSPASAPTGRPSTSAASPSFERDVLRKTMEIPFGEVRPYSWVAREIGRPRAVRAVGSALAGNPIAVRHPLPPRRARGRADRRVRRRRAGGEARRCSASRAWTRRSSSGWPTSASAIAAADTTGIYCYPSCRHARRITARHRVRFRRPTRRPRRASGRAAVPAARGRRLHDGRTRRARRPTSWRAGAWSIGLCQRASAPGPTRAGRGRRRRRRAAPPSAPVPGRPGGRAGSAPGTRTAPARPSASLKVE